MSVSQFSISCESHKNNIYNGFSQLQQNQEFVDMTLAAEGSFVKVHKNIVALASPYLKELLQSLPCEHPVIFLSNISQDILAYILEYIYMGEVKIPENKLSSFVSLAQKLKISGVSSLKGADKPILRTQENSTMPLNIAEEAIVSRPTQIAASIVINSHDNNDYNLQVQKFPDNDTTVEPTTYTNIPMETVNFNDQLNGPDGNNMDCETAIEVEQLTDNVSNRNNYIGSLQSSLDNITADIKDYPIVTTVPDTISDKDILLSDLNPLYTISNRGSLQLILNRFIYYAHHRSLGGRKCRWRCLDYRPSHCKAYIDTENHTIVARKFCHVHPFHDKQILQKIQEHKVYSSIMEAKHQLSVKEKSNKSVDITNEVGDEIED